MSEISAEGTVAAAGEAAKADAWNVRALADRLPAGFVLGAATASYQIEGAVTEDGRGASIWDTFSRTPGRTLDGDTGDVACDHYHRWADDVALMAELGLRGYRFSVAWPRVQPDGAGAPNERGLDFYDRLVDGLLERGIEPWLTLYHWDLPQALEDAGGWPAREIADRFGEYARIVARRLGDRVGRWITLNEPEIIATHGYGFGVHAPGRRDWAAALLTSHHLQLAHRAAAAAIGAEAPAARIGITLNVAPIQPASPEPDDLEAATRRDLALHAWYLDPLFGRGYPLELLERYGPLLDGVDPSELQGRARVDMLGLNYYSRELVRDDPASQPLGISHAPPRLATTAMGWEVHPDGLREVLARIARNYSPPEIAITENGAAYDDIVRADGAVGDDERRAYLAAHLDAAADAIGAGVPLSGYFAWSLLDNFEWALGYSKRFGIVRVDYATQRRTIKDSGRWYAALIRAAR